MKKWSTLKNLIWLYAAKLNASAIIETITGNLPLVLQNAIQHSIKSLTRYGLCTQSGTPTPDAPVSIMCNNGVLKWDSVNERIYSDGTPEVLTVRGVNLCNPAYYQGDGWYIGTNNTVLSAESNGTLVFPCKPNTTYSWWHTSGAGGARAFELTTDEVTAGQSATWAVGNPAYSDAMTVRKYTTSANAKLLCVLFARVADQVGRTIDEQLADFMFVEGYIEEAFAYQPYHEPQTASVVDLLSVGSYADTQEIVSGAVKRNCGVIVLDGTETYWGTGRTVLTNCYTLAVPLGDGSMTNRRVFCTHFKSSDALPDSNARQGYALLGNGGTSTTEPLTNKYTVAFGATPAYKTVDSFKEFLAAQYAAGTPVIVVYPLAEATTESVAGQSLRTVAGTNVVSVTAEVSPVALSCEYYATE